MGVLYAMSSRSDLGPAGRLPDWVGHCGAWLLLALLLCRALAGGIRPLSPGAAALAVALATAYGVADEYHQSFVAGRDASAADVGKDLAGAAAGALLFFRATAARAGRSG